MVWPGHRPRPRHHRRHHRLRRRRHSLEDSLQEVTDHVQEQLVDEGNWSQRQPERKDYQHLGQESVK